MGKVVCRGGGDRHKLGVSALSRCFSQVLFSVLLAAFDGAAPQNGRELAIGVFRRWVRMVERTKGGKDKTNSEEKNDQCVLRHVIMRGEDGQSATASEFIDASQAPRQGCLPVLFLW
jgi:hypothetical protein